MNYRDALAVVDRMIELADVVRGRAAGVEIFDEFAMLYGRIAKVVATFIPHQEIQVRGWGDTHSVHANYIEAGFMAGSGIYEAEGRAQLLQLKGALSDGATRSPAASVVLGLPPLVSEERIAQLRTLPPRSFDFSRLIRICEELNVTFEARCYLATSALIRTLLNHVPPVFGEKAFEQVVSQHGDKSFKEVMEHLQNGARKIADSNLHGPIRKTETLPTETQVGFAPQLDVLLAEVIRLSQ